MPTDSNIPVRWTTPLLLSAILVLAAAVRLPGLGTRGYFLDELWTVELASGRGSMHLHLPMNHVIEAPELYALKSAPPWWQVWTHLEIPHPPLYFVLLRLWMDLFGEGDGIERLFSVIASLASIAVLFDVVRMLNGRSVAIWASLLMAVSEPQVEYARLTRNYALLLLLALSATDALVRIEKMGITRWRLATLVLALLTTLLTHYFCIGAIAAMGIYACIRLRGRSQQATILAFAAAGVLFILCWGPFMWQQRPLFSPSEPSAMFLEEHTQTHVRDSMRRFLSVPLDMMMPRHEKFLTIATASAVLYVFPLFLWRRRPDLQLWILWLIGTTTVVLTMDLTRHTAHLEYIRYTLLAGPAVFALIPALVSDLKQKWIACALPATMLIATAIALPAAYHTWIVDPHTIVDDIQPLIGPNDILVSIATGDMAWKAGSNYLMLSRYLRPFPCPIVLLNTPPNPQVLSAAMQSGKILAFTDIQDAGNYFPHTTRVGGQMYQGQSLVWVLQPSHQTAPR